MNDTFEMNIIGHKIKEINHFNLLYNELKIIQPKLRRILTKDNVWKNTIIVMNFLGGVLKLHSFAYVNHCNNLILLFQFDLS